MARRPLDDSEADFIALLTDLDERLNALRTRLPARELAHFDKRAEAAARSINRSMALTLNFLHNADTLITPPRPRGGNVVTLRPRPRRRR